MKAVLSVIGKDKAGIIAKVSGYLFDIKANIEDISQTVMNDYFAMIMLVDIANMSVSIGEMSSRLDALGEKTGVKIHVQHEDVFNAMHKI
jgi:ACT domain-containing protein